MRAIKRWIYVTSLAVITAMIAFLLLHMSGMAV